MTCIKIIVQIMHFIENSSIEVLNEQQKNELREFIKEIDVIEFEDYKLVLAGSDGIYLKDLYFGKTHFISDVDLGLCDTDDFNGNFNALDILNLAEPNDIFDLAVDIISTVALINS